MFAPPLASDVMYGALALPMTWVNEWFSSITTTMWSNAGSAAAAAASGSIAAGAGWIAAAAPGAGAAEAAGWAVVRHRAVHAVAVAAARILPIRTETLLTRGRPQWPAAGELPPSQPGRDQRVRTT